MKDVTEEEAKKESAFKARLESAEMAQKVIEKQMIAAQEIASAGNIVPNTIRVVVRGRAAKLTGGKLKRASTMDSGVTLNILYILIEVNGESVVELDKMNPTYKVNGVDLLAEYKEMC